MEPTRGVEYRTEMEEIRGGEWTSGMAESDADELCVLGPQFGGHRWSCLVQKSEAAQMNNTIICAINGNRTC